MIERFDHDAFAGTFVCGVDGQIDLRVGDTRHAIAHIGAVASAFAGVEEDGRAEVFGLFLDDPESVVANVFSKFSL